MNNKEGKLVLEKVNNLSSRFDVINKRSVYYLALYFEFLYVFVILDLSPCLFDLSLHCLDLPAKVIKSLKRIGGSSYNHGLQL